jgi:hypothetical protein
MYDDIVAVTAVKLSSRSGVVATKTDRTYTARIEELLLKLNAMGFGSWKEMPTPGGSKIDDPDAVLEGVEEKSGDLVTLRVYHNHAKRVPKNLSFVLLRQRNNRGIVIGVHVGTLRMTDLRTKQSTYDGADWGLQHFRVQLAVESFREKITIPAEIVEAHLAAAAAKLVELGITETRHAILPRAGEEYVRDIDMVPFLVGRYGDMPVAIRLRYSEPKNITLEFYIVGALGLVCLDFGYMKLDNRGNVDDSHMDIGKLLAGPTKK